MVIFSPKSIFTHCGRDPELIQLDWTSLLATKYARPGNPNFPVPSDDALIVTPFWDGPDISGSASTAAALNSPPVLMSSHPVSDRATSVSTCGRESKERL